jgi:hypothetical protein
MSTKRIIADGAYGFTFGPGESPIRQYALSDTNYVGCGDRSARAPPLFLPSGLDINSTSYLIRALHYPYMRLCRLSSNKSNHSVEQSLSRTIIFILIAYNTRVEKSKLLHCLCHPSVCFCEGLTTTEALCQHLPKYLVAAY